ncbi:protein kinase [Purpureocillium lavendulum]|uniref:Protein kinase n=1 Tax=Purpureocillium lavendulum TaxID=1247861 RepID=A0AB34FDU9_9HYPO|nr:transposase [Purpureocillium lavendulum]KAJ6437628.1 protein kinase [Purpureocillium lavendulum]
MAQSQYDNESAYSEPTQVENRTPPPEVRATEPERGAAAVAASSADEAHRLIHDRNLWVLGLPLHVTEADVRSLFQEYSGTDVAIQMSGFDVNGMYNIAYVWMSSVAEARRAYSQLKGRRLEKDGNAYTLQIRQANQESLEEHLEHLEHLGFEGNKTGSASRCHRNAVPWLKLPFNGACGCVPGVLSVCPRSAACVDGPKNWT